MTSRRWFSVVILTLAATAALLVAGTLYAIKTVEQPGYTRLAGDPSLELQDNPFRWNGRRCDVLVYGDSTADVGIDPRVITAGTGLSACNIAATRPLVDDLGTIPVDAFLKHNPKPRILVLQLGPETFYRARNPWEHVGPYAAMLMLSRDLPRDLALRTMLAHPTETTQFTLFILQRLLFPMRVDRPRLDAGYDRVIAHSEASGGQLELDGPAQTACLAPPLHLNGPVDVAWIARLRRTYQAQGIAVVVRASPVPSCDPQLAQFQREIAPYVDGNVDANPVEGFLPGDRHTSAAGSLLDSLQLTRLIEAKHPELIAHPANSTQSDRK